MLTPANHREPKATSGIFQHAVMVEPSLTVWLCEDAHGRGDETAGAYAVAIQALRDVRHMLPPEGVAIVDLALTGVT